MFLVYPNNNLSLVDANLQLPQCLPHAAYNISRQGEALLAYDITDDGLAGDVNLQLPHSLPDSPYNTRYQGEAIFTYGNTTDKGLVGDLSNDLKGQVATSYRHFDADIPVVIGNGSNGILSLRLLTDSRKKVMFPYYTTINDVTQVDSIEETDDGTVTIRLGDDVMVFRVQRDVKCDFNEKEKIGKVFDQVVGKVIATTSYPSRFDWGCQVLGSGVSFCKVLHKVGCELAAVEGDVCTLTSTTSSKRCLATFTIVEMTGIFQEFLPVLAEMVPSESFEAESIKRNHTTGIIYPCLTP
ncbi:hypothetical protein HOLleu_13767 [Holothuria leucospilota]|uniref:Uncharacterized protein n=1 Tax=Holothuria leucospilota TaxID=206669 RepID=A0A9Q1C6M9_HOLLE|nr:hypothetical protein HOLleu_13767 [Holothuria leucospilota]